MKKLCYLLVALAVLAGCAAPTATPTQPVTNPLPEPSVTSQLPTETLAPPTEAPTLAPSLTPTATQVPAGRIPVIEYHDPNFKLSETVQMTPQWFDDELRWLFDNGYTALSADELAQFVNGQASFPQKSVVLTFDLGLPKRDAYANIVMPALRKYHLKAILFLVVNTNIIEDTCGQAQRFCWSELKQWQDEGLISVESHGISHPDYAKLTSGEMRYDAGRSKELIEQNLGHPVVAFAFPFDSAPPAGQMMIKTLNYQLAFSGNTRADLTVYPNDTDRYRLPRMYPYSNPNLYPLIYGSNKTFGDMLTAAQAPGVAVVPPAGITPTPLVAEDVTATPGAAQPTQPEATQAPTQQAASSNVDEVEKFCQYAPTTEPNRDQAFSAFSFTTDLSPQAVTNLPLVQTTPSCNFYKDNKPEVIVLHYTGGPLTGSIATFRADHSAAAHYIVDTDGKVIQMVPERLAALHVNCNGVRANCMPKCPVCDGPNGELTEPYSRSIGIEIVNRGHINPDGFNGQVFEDYLKSFGYRYWEDYPEVQIQAIKTLVEDIAARWNIPVDDQHIIGHYRVNPKVDPGPALNLFWPRVGTPARGPIFP